MIFMAPEAAGQTQGVAALEKEALGYFQQKAYARALEDYNKLLEAYPRDPGYNYHAGVCMTELGQEPEKAIYRLKIASLNEAPPDVFFYLGKACYQAGKYDEAIGWYDRFSQKASSGERKSYHLEKFITEAKMARDQQVAGGHKGPAPRQLSPQEQASVTALAYRHRADSLEKVIAAGQEALAAMHDPAEKEQQQRRISAWQQELARYRQQAGIWAVRAGEGEKGEGNDYTLFGPGDQATRVLAPVNPVSEEEAAPFLELAGEDFYKNPGMRKIFSQEDISTLEGYRALTRQGDDYMKEAWKQEQEAARQQMIVNTSANGRERSRAENRIKSLDQEKKNKRLEAVKFFQQANDGEYAMNKKYIASLVRAEGIPPERKKQGESFRKEAERNYGKALQLREEAAGGPAGDRYDKLMEANAYELMALDNQRKALATLAGLMPSTHKDMAHVTVAKKPHPAPGKTVKKKHTPEISSSPVPEEKVYRKPAPLENPAREKNLEDYPYGLVMNPAEKYKESKDIPVAGAMAPGVNYRLQIGVFSKTPDMSYFRGMYPLFREEVPGKGLTRYFAGQFRTYGEAAHTLLRLREMGYKDAIVVGYYNGKRSSVSRIRPLEDEQPYTNLQPVAASPSHPQPEVQTRTKGVAPAKPADEKISLPEKTLLYRVQVGAFSKPLPAEKLNALEELAGRDHVVIRTQNNQGYYIYAIGNFTTFDEAKRFRNILAERGMSGCFVTAYRNGKRILIGEDRGK